MSSRIEPGKAEKDELRSVPRDVPPELGRRIGVAAAIVLAAFIAIIARLVSLQVVQGPEMRSLSEHNRIRLVRVPSARGVVYDRNGELLIDNRAVLRRRVRSRGRPRQAGGAAHARRRTSTSPRTPSPSASHAPSKRPPYEGIVMRRDLDWPGVVALETHQLELPGVSLRVGTAARLSVRAAGGASPRLRGRGERERARADDECRRRPAGRSGRQDEPREVVGRGAARQAGRAAGRGRRARPPRARPRGRCPTSRATTSS